MDEKKNETPTVKKWPEPMWEAMDCPDVTDDPFYNFD